MKLEWERLLRTFPRLFRRKNDLSGLKKQMKLKTYTETQYEVRRADNLFASRIDHVQVQNAYLRIISALEPSNLSHVTFFILANALISISERSGPKIWANKHFLDGDRHDDFMHTTYNLDKRLPRGGGDMTKRDHPTVLFWWELKVTPIFCHDSTDGWKINHEPIAWQEWVDPIVHYFISKLTIPFAAPYYFQKPFTNSEPSCIKDGRKVIYKGRLNTNFFQSFWALPRICLHFGRHSCKRSRNVPCPRYVSTKFKSA